MQYLTIPARDGGTFRTYLAKPKKLPAPAVVVIQEIFGVNDELKEKCDDLAREGYIAAAPDLFWRMERDVNLTDRTEAEWAKAFDLYNRFDIDTGLDDLRQTAHTLKGHAECTGRVGCIGFCLGGKLAYLMAARSKIDSAVSYYGVGIENLLEEAGNVRNPLLMHIAQEDKFVSKEAQKKIHNVLDKSPLVTIHSYPGVNHAFTRKGGEHFDAATTKTAKERTLTFLQKTLSLAEAA